jgi:alkylation response protein AidB-like acyl-CoA dehydrogenase
MPDPARSAGLETNAVPADILDEMRDKDLFGITIPESYGGAGLNVSQYVETIRRLSYAAPAYRSALSIGVGMVASALKTGGTADQKSRWLPQLSAGAIASFQLIQAMLADSRTEIYAAECMIADACRRADEGRRTTIEASAAKMFASEMCGRVVDRVVQIHGGAGYLQEYAAERFYRDARLYRIYEGTTQILQLLIARNMLKDFAAQH